MSSFANSPDEWQRLDYQLLQNGAVNLYFNQQVLSEDTAWLKNHGYVIHVLNAAGWLSADDFHKDVSEILGFPGYYGRNLDAFNDCLGDIEISETEGGCVLQLLGFDKLAAALPELARPILDIIEIQSRRHLLTGQRLLALVQSDDPRISFEHLGCLAATWNPKEWLHKNRGL
ncbi:MAG TPA: barstar family protein [Oculatellaceae cyanobacterium]